MDERERNKLKTGYASLSDDDFVEILSSAGEFEEEVRELILLEGRRRNIQKKTEEIQKLKEKQKEGSDKEWVEAYHIFNLIEAPLVENILMENDIPVQTFYYSAAPLYQLYSPVKEKGVILVEKANSEKAKRIIKELQRAEGQEDDLLFDEN